MWTWAKEQPTLKMGANVFDHDHIKPKPKKKNYFEWSVIAAIIILWALAAFVFFWTVNCAGVWSSGNLGALGGEDTTCTEDSSLYRACRYMCETRYPNTKGIQCQKKSADTLYCRCLRNVDKAETDKELYLNVEDKGEVEGKGSTQVGTVP